MQKLDSFTVKELELTAPGYCRQDAARLYRKLQQGRIFKFFGSSEREKIWINVLAVSTERLIPSLQTFFDDVKYLQRPAECIKRLTGHGASGSSLASLKYRFTDVGQHPNDCIFQVSETKFETRPGNHDDRREIGYRTVWICAMRNCLEISAKENKRGKDRLAKNSYKEDETVDCRFGCLAYRVGFESSAIHDLIQRSADREIARSALLRARNPKYYSYSTENFNAYIDKIVDFFNAASEISGTSVQTTMDTKSQDDDELPNRSGLPKLHHHVKDQKQLFVDTLHSTISGGGIINSFFVRRSVYLAFFGHLSDFVERLEGETYNAAEAQSVYGDQTERTQVGVANDAETMHDIQEVEVQRMQQDEREEGHDVVKRFKKKAVYAHDEIGRKNKENKKRLRVQVAKRIQEEEAVARRIQEREEAATANRIQEEAAFKRIQEREEAAAAQRIQEEAAVIRRIQEREEAATANRIREEAAAVKRIQEREEAATANRIQEEAALKRIQEREEAAVTRGIQEREEAVTANRIQEAAALKRIQEREEAVTANRIQEEAAFKRIQEREEAAAAQRIQEEAAVIRRIQEREEAATANRIQEAAAAVKRIQERVEAAAAQRIQEEEAVAAAEAAAKRVQQKKNTARVTQIGMEIEEREDIIFQSPTDEMATVNPRPTSSPLLSEDIQTLNKPDIEEIRTSQFRVVGSIIPQKRKKDFVIYSEELARKKLDRKEIQQTKDRRAIIEVLEENNGEWVTKGTISASPYSKWDAKRFEPYNEGWTLEDSRGKLLCRETCFEDVIQDGTYKIYLVPRQDQSRQRLDPPSLDLLNNRAQVGYSTTIFT
jgi:hypothetical protein